MTKIDNMSIGKGEKKVLFRPVHITVLEWLSQEDDAVYQNWELPNGEIIKRMTPYNELPYVTFKPLNTLEEKL